MGKAVAPLGLVVGEFSCSKLVGDAVAEGSVFGALAVGSLISMNAGGNVVR